MAVEIERYIVELGTEGRLIEMQLEEVMVGVAAERPRRVHEERAEDVALAPAAVVDLLPGSFGRFGRAVGSLLWLGTDELLPPEALGALGPDPVEVDLVEQVLRAGLDDGSIGALFANTFRATAEQDIA